MQRSATNFISDNAMLLVNAFSKRIFTFRIEGQEIEVIVRAPMQNPAPAIDGGVDQGVGGAAVLGLDVIDRVAHFHIRVMPKEHVMSLHFPRGAFAENTENRAPQDFFQAI
jgi:hypothetical protein